MFDEALWYVPSDLLCGHSFLFCLTENRIWLWDQKMDSQLFILVAVIIALELLLKIIYQEVKLYLCYWKWSVW